MSVLYERMSDNPKLNITKNSSIRDIDRQFIQNSTKQEKIKSKLKSSLQTKNEAYKDTDKTPTYKRLDRKTVRENKKQILDITRDLLKPSSKRIGEYSSGVEESFLSFLSNAVDHITFLKKKEIVQGRYASILEGEQNKSLVNNRFHTIHETLTEREMNDMMMNEVYTNANKPTTIPDMIPLIRRTSGVGKTNKQKQEMVLPQQIKYD